MATVARSVKVAPAPPAAELQVLAPWAPELADTFVALSCDIALVIDGDGRIVKLAQHDEHPIAPLSWVGSDWAGTASDDSRGKVLQTLADVAATGHAQRREINHPGALGGPAPVAYSAARLGDQGPTLAVGHDLRAQAALQQRFVAAQEALERAYWTAQQQSTQRAHRAVRGAATRNHHASAQLMTDDERQSLGLDLLAEPGTKDLDDSELVRALGRLYERIGHGNLPGLLRDARRLAERHFLARALQRAGSVDELAKSLGVSRRTLARRGSQTRRPKS